MTRLQTEVIMWSKYIAWDDRCKEATMLFMVCFIWDINQSFSITVSEVGRMWRTKMNLQMKRTICTYCGTPYNFTVNRKKYTSGKVLHLLAILTLHTNKTKNNDRIIENNAHNMYITKKLIVLSVAMCLGHERQIHNKHEDQASIFHQPSSFLCWVVMQCQLVFV